MKTPKTVLIGLTAAAIAALGVVASPADAADSCVGKVGITLKDGNLIKGSGYISGCSGTSHTIHMRIEKKTILGAWSTLVHKDVTGGNGASGGMAYNCSGTGTQTYQTVVDWYTVGGDYKKAVSNNIRVSC